MHNKGACIRSVLSLWKGRIPVHSLPATSPTLRQIALKVAERHEMTLEELRRVDQKQGRWSAARRDFIATAYATGRFSTIVIGQFMGGRDHASILYHLNKYGETHGAGSLAA